MSPSTRRRNAPQLRAAVALAALALLIFTSPAAATEPVRETDNVTSVECDAATNAGGTVRLKAALSDLSGTNGFLQYWSGDPDATAPSLVGEVTTFTVAEDGTIAVTFDVFEGGLGLSEDDQEPVFVGVAELTLSVEPGEITEIDDRFTGGGNHLAFRRGFSQELDVTDGQASVPTVGTFSLTGADCGAERESTTTFATQPAATISDAPFMVLQCSAATADGFVEFLAMAGDSTVFLAMTVVDGDDWFYGETQGLSFTTRGAEGSAVAPNVLDPSVAGSGTVSADFTVVDRIRTRFLTEDGWFARTEYVVTVEGTMTFDAPGIAIEVSLDGCYTDIRTGMAKS